MQPLKNRLVVDRVLAKELATAVRDFAGGFGQKQTLFRNSQVDPSHANLASDASVVAGRIVTKQTDHESILAPRGSVTAARIAAATGHDGNDVLFKADRQLLCAASDFDGDPNLAATKIANQLGLTIGNGEYLVPIDAGNLLVGECPARVGGHIECDVIDATSHRDEGLVVTSGGQIDRLRIDREIEVWLGLGARFVKQCRRFGGRRFGG